MLEFLSNSPQSVVSKKQMNPIVLFGLEIYDYTKITKKKINCPVQSLHFVLKNLLSRIRILKCREEMTNKHINFYTITSPLHYELASHFSVSQYYVCVPIASSRKDH